MDGTTIFRRLAGDLTPGGGGIRSAVSGYGVESKSVENDRKARGAQLQRKCFHMEILVYFRHEITTGSIVLRCEQAVDALHDSGTPCISTGYLAWNLRLSVLWQLLIPVLSAEIVVLCYCRNL